VVAEAADGTVSLKLDEVTDDADASESVVVVVAIVVALTGCIDIEGTDADCSSSGVGEAKAAL
jgi:hypothetical protein